MDPELQAILARLREQQGGAADWLAQQPGVGQGMLDTLQATHIQETGSPVAFDTTSAMGPNVGGRYLTGAGVDPTVQINPEYIRSLIGAQNAETVTPELLAHEAIGHAGGKNQHPPGTFGGEAERAARAFLRVTGRDPNIPIRGVEDVISQREVENILRTIGLPSEGAALPTEGTWGSAVPKR